MLRRRKVLQFREARQLFRTRLVSDRVNPKSRWLTRHLSTRRKGGTRCRVQSNICFVQRPKARKWSSVLPDLTLYFTRVLHFRSHPRQAAERCPRVLFSNTTTSHHHQHIFRPLTTLYSFATITLVDTDEINAKVPVVHNAH